MTHVVEEEGARPADQVGHLDLPSGVHFHELEFSRESLGMIVVISSSSCSAADDVIGDIMDFIAVLIGNESLGCPGVGCDDDGVLADHSADCGSGLDEVFLDLVSWHDRVISCLVFEVEAWLMELLGVV